MAALEQAQRDAILRRYGGVIQTYFSRTALRGARFTPVAQLTDSEREFYVYLRLSGVLHSAQELVALLDRVVLAAASEQVRVMERSRGGLAGTLDPAAYARRYGQRSGTPTFPVRRVRANFAVDENVFAAACARGLLAELQSLLATIELPPSSERDLVAEIAQLLDMYLRDPALQGAAAWGVPDVGSDDFEEVAARVAERWQNRRVNNIAYVELLDWAKRFQSTALPGEGAFTGLVYSEDFDDRLFELFVLGCLRDSFANLGFNEATIRPLHQSGKDPVLELVHPDTGAGLALFFQRAAQVLWSESAPRDWPTVGAVPDLVLRPDSLNHPVVIIDVKNRRRRAKSDGADGEVEDPGFRASEEVYKMLGYFLNLHNTVVAGGRGPVGGLVFQGGSIASGAVEHRSRSGKGLLVLDDWDPTSDALTAEDGPVDKFVSLLLEWAGLMGGRRPDGRDMRGELEQAYGPVGSADAGPAETPDEPGLIEQLDRLHDFTQKHYWEGRGPAVLRAEQDLEAHLLGSGWRELTSDERQFLATAEVFWRDHRDGIGMDFGPVVIELAKAFESVVDRLVFGPFKAWAAESGRKAGKLDTMGDMRAELDRAKEIAGGGTHGKGAKVLDDYLARHGLQAAAYGPLLEALMTLNGPRRAAAHPYAIKGVDAEAFRSRMLGVGQGQPVLASVMVLFNG
jgi:hypothetical protein